MLWGECISHLRCLSIKLPPEYWPASKIIRNFGPFNHYVSIFIRNGIS